MSDLLTSRDSILAAMRRRITKVEVEGLGTVCIRSLSGAQRARLADLFKTAGGEQTQEDSQREIQARIVSRVVVDENGVRLFGDTEDELAIVADMDAKVLDDLTFAGMKASGLKTDGVADAVKNSAPSPIELPLTG